MKKQQGIGMVLSLVLGILVMGIILSAATMAQAAPGVPAIRTVEPLATCEPAIMTQEPIVMTEEPAIMTEMPVVMTVEVSQH